jgi:alkanesulfonate monooxygenase SsuD/methylene tetrahydromethanopterin reductase-like flavin-dependent oxidoreductase (luciferase family)
MLPTRQAAVWRFVRVAESQRGAEDELVAALRERRRHMVHTRATHNPADFTVDPSRVNPWNDPRVSDADGVRHSLEVAARYGTADRVADQVAEMRDAGVYHVLCQISYGYLPHARIMASMRRFGEQVMPRFR